MIERALGVSESRRVVDFSLSPNGRLFAVNVVTHESNAPTDRQGHLIVLNTDGSNARELFTPGRPNALQIATWSSDSEHILVWIDADFSASLAADGLPLVSVPAGGGPVVRLFDHVLTYSDFLSVSPHQSVILVVSGSQRDSWTEKRLMLADPATGQTTPLTDEKSAIAAAVWSPDGTRIAYVSSPDNRHVETATVVRPNGQRATRQFIASGDQSNLADRRLWIMNGDGADKHQLTNDPQYRDEHPQWSHDGQRIVFTRLDKQGHASIWSMDVSNGNVRQVVSSIDSPGPFGYYGHLDWSSYVAWLTH
jgi:dipeptidyl aminopeptidase/acylaminoacyl peptidase